MGIKSWRFFPVVFLAVFALCSCTKKPYLDIAEGRFLWNRGEYSKAVASFLHGKENSREDDFTEGVAYSNYGLALCYLQLNELSVAEGILQETTLSHDAVLAKDAFYNLGVLAYSQGNYSLAEDCFKNCIKKSSLDAPVPRDVLVNLELSILAKNAEIARESSRIKIQETGQEIEGMNTVFNIYREKEYNRWLPSEDTAGTGYLDY